MKHKYFIRSRLLTIYIGSKAMKIGINIHKTMINLHINWIAFD